MDQYNKTSPEVASSKKTSSAKETQSDIKKLQTLVDEQDLRIKDLEKEIRRIKNKIDLHAAAINGMRRG
jgi:peptidoglycan hydrolase CwlO-like protein